MKRVVIKSIALIVLFLCVAAVQFVLGVGLPHWMISISDQEWPPKKIRDACHASLRNWATGGHNAFITLEREGNKDSIPYLIRALKWQNVQNGKPNEDVGVVCTHAHCMDTLEKLTGMNFRGDYKAWCKWWRQTGRYLPFDEEKGQLGLPKGETGIIKEAI